MSQPNREHLALECESQVIIDWNSSPWYGRESWLKACGYELYSGYRCFQWDALPVEIQDSLLRVWLEERSS